MSAGASRPRQARRAAVVAVVLVLGLVAVLVGLVSAGRGVATPTAPGSSVRATGGRATAVRPTASRATAPSASTRRPTTSSTAAAGRDPETGLRLVALSQLPREAQATVALIDAGGPFPYPKDGVTFGNYEKVLPAHPRGWYREYTVRTPGESDRGPRRIVTGDDDRLIFYTGDHYASFVRVTR